MAVDSEMFETLRSCAVVVNCLRQAFAASENVAEGYKYLVGLRQSSAITEDTYFKLPGIELPASELYFLTDAGSLSSWIDYFS